jgi:hypothetical protein
MTSLKTSRKPVTIVLRAKTAAEKKKIEEVEYVLSRNVGFPVKLSQVWTDDKGDEWRSSSWPMSKHDINVLKMLERRGKTHGSAALAKPEDWQEKSLKQVLDEKKLTAKQK